ncbi:MAG TPA: DUF1236 domain-containing protein [Pseudolabrys sp.]
MRKVRLLSTVAATLLLVGAASAQEMKKDEAPARAPAAQQNAPAEKVAPAQKIAPAMKSERKMPETTGQAPKEPEGGQMKGPADKDSHTDKAAPMGKAGEPHAQAPADMKAKSTANEGAATKANESAAQDHKSTTGQGAAAGRANLSTEQRTKISAVFKQHRVSPTHLNVSVSVGTRVPDSVHFYPLPQEVYAIYPEWRGYEYILVGDQILVIDPGSHEIVAILEA